MALDEAVADDHHREHHLSQFRHLEGDGQQIVHFLVVAAHELGPAGVAHRVKVGMSGVNGQRPLVHFPGLDAHDHGQAFAGHGEEVLGLQEQALGRSIVYIAATLAGHGLHRGQGGEFVRRLEVHEFGAEQIFLAHGRGPGELLGDGRGRRDGVTAEAVHYPGQD